MNDPHVETLRFRVNTDKGIAYKDDAPPVSYETVGFKAILDKGVLTMTMKEHFATPGEAIRRFQTDLRSWEILTGVRFGPGSLRFDFEGADVIDRAPPPPGSPQTHSASASLGGVATVTAEGRALIGCYPDPPTQFKADPTVEVLWRRYGRFRHGGEPRTGMGYFCLSVVQADAGGKGKAATKFGIQIDVLNKLGELTSQAGDDTEARKRDPGSTYAPLTEKQRIWIEAAVCKLILRTGEYASNPKASRPQITMADLPAL